MTRKTRILAVGVIAPLVIGFIGALVVVLSLPYLPDPIATHWGPSGTADGFGSVAVLLVILLVIVVGYSAFAYFVARSPGPDFALNQRLILSVGPFLATLLAILLAGSVVVQRGLEDARDAPTILPLIGLGYGSAALVGIAAWFLLPRHTPLPDLDAEDVPILDLGDTQRATWTRTIGPPRWVRVAALVAFAFAIFVGGTAIWAYAPTAGFAIYLSSMVLAGALVASTMSWRVTIDANSLRVRSALGVPRATVAIGEIEKAGVVQVDPAREFGGWGMRWGGPGRLGIILRRGEALEVRRTNGKSLVVTVSGARTAAALLNSLVQRVQ